MAKQANPDGKEIVIAANDKELKFGVNLAAYTDFQNQFLPNDKVAPSENFLLRCVYPENRELLVNLCAQGLATDIAGLVAEQFKPAVKLSVKQ